jgi:3-deoxy-D-arabino-heptulosonate 7-phosphate (DAHP) synthase
VILRGGKAPNYSPADVAQCEKEMEQAGLRPALMVDCSHGNSNKKITVVSLRLLNPCRADQRWQPFYYRSDD